MTIPKNLNAMKLTKLFNLTALGVSLTLFASGCRHTPTGVTHIKGYPPGGPGNPEALGSETALHSPKDSEGNGAGIPLGPGHSNYHEDPNNPLKDQTIHFDYDKSAIRSSEQSKLDAVASYMKSNPDVALRVEGNCDERGTEEYNRALGERRALAGREYLIRQGVGADRIDTISYGLDRPVDTGNTEAAHAKNRRDDFVVLLPPGK